MRSTSLSCILLFLSAAALAHDGGGVESVVPGGAAAAAGMRAGDRIVTIDGQPLSTRADLQKIIDGHKPGDTVPLVVERDGRPGTLRLTFGARPDGGASLGVALRLVEAAEGEPGQPAGPDSATARCLAWIEETYRVEATLGELRLDLAEDYATVRRCVERDTRRMSTENAVRYCDNVFKIHCSAGDLLAQIGEAWLGRCAAALDEDLGPGVGRASGWRTCAEPKLIDGYLLAGTLPSTADCRTALLATCGTSLDGALADGTLTAEQRAFVACCSASAPDPTACAMLHAGATQGPCRDRAVCVHRETTEWLTCPPAP